MELTRRSFALGILAGLILSGCASFGYKYYGLQGVGYENGILLGPKPADDIPFSQCAPTDQVKNPCVVMFAKDFFAMKLDYEDTKDKLKACEAARND